MAKEPIRLQGWKDFFAKWVHCRLGPPNNSHDVTFVTENGKLGWTGPIHASADREFAADALVVDVAYDESEPEATIVHPEFKGGRFIVTLQLITADGVVAS